MKKEVRPDWTISRCKDCDYYLPSIRECAETGEKISLPDCEIGDKCPLEEARSKK